MVQSHTTWLAVLLTLAAAGLPAASASAQDDGEDAKPTINAAREYQRANRLASAGAITRSIPHYEKVLEAAPQQYSFAYFNLAEVWKAKDEAKKAVLHYQGYRAIGTDAETKEQAAAAVRQLVGDRAGKLNAQVTPEKANVYVDGLLMATDGRIEALELLPGEYTVRATVADHKPAEKTVTVGAGEAANVELDLVMKLFYGTALIEVDQPGATIKLTPKELDNPQAPDAVITVTSPMKEPKELATGKYFLEVTREGYDRWIRNVVVTRDNDTVVTVTLTKALPEAIRPK